MSTQKYEVIDSWISPASGEQGSCLKFERVRSEGGEMLWRVSDTRRGGGTFCDDNDMRAFIDGQASLKDYVTRHLA